MPAIVTPIRPSTPYAQIAHIVDYYVHRLEQLRSAKRRAAEMRRTAFIAGHFPAGSPDAWRG